MIRRTEISVSNETFSRLQKLAQPLVDDSDSIISKLLDAYEVSLCTKINSNTHQTREECSSVDRVFHPISSPDFTHSTLLSGKVGETHVKDGWNYLLREAYIHAYEASHGDLSRLRQIAKECGREESVRRGITSGKGLKPVKKHNFSVQGVTANQAYSISLRLAMEFCFSVSVLVRWQPKEKAAYPGKTGQINWLPLAQPSTSTHAENNIKVHKTEEDMRPCLDLCAPFMTAEDSAYFISENIPSTATKTDLKKDLCFDAFDEYIRANQLQLMLDAAAKKARTLVAEATGEVKSYSYIATLCGQKGKDFVFAFRKQFSVLHRKRMVEYAHKTLGLNEEERDGTRSIYARWLNAQLGFIVDF